MFAYIFTVEGFGKIFQEWLMTVSSGNATVIMLLVGAFVLLIGCFMEPVAVMPVVLPLVYPLLQKLGMNMVQFGLFFTLCTIVGGLTPPVGSYLFVTVTVVKTGVTKLIPWMMVMQPHQHLSANPRAENLAAAGKNVLVAGRRGNRAAAVRAAALRRPFAAACGFGTL